MSKTSEFFTEFSEVKREGVDRLEMISLASDIMSDSVSTEEATDKMPVEITGDSGRVSSNNQGGMKACPADSVENSPAEKLAKGRKMKEVRAVFWRVWKAVKRPFHCHDPNKVVRLTPQPDQDDSELMPALSPIRITPTADTDPELVCLPGQVCEDVEPLCAPGPSGTEQTLDTDLADPESSPVADPSSSDLGDDKPKKQRKRKAVRVFFSRFRKAVKHLFLCRDSERVHSTTQVDLDNSEKKLADGAISFEPKPGCQTRSDQVCAALQSPSVQAANADPATPALSHVSYSSDLETGLKCASRVSLFLVGELLGCGSFGMVYEGTHLLCDRIKVAMKYIQKRHSDRYLDVAGHSKPVLAEVAMLLRLGEPPLCPNVIKLHEWIEYKRSFVLIMEYPQPCHTLNQHIMYSDGINEEKARWIICQLIQAVKHCFDRGVFHGDIHTGNILVTDTSLELKLIDFGCAYPISSEGNLSSEYRGAPLCTPPEVIGNSTFHANPAYVWAVGLVLFEILHGYLPFESQAKILHGYVQAKPTLSLACHDLIFQCLIYNPATRPMLQHLEEHRWFKN